MINFGLFPKKYATHNMCLFNFFFFCVTENTVAETHNHKSTYNHCNMMLTRCSLSFISEHNTFIPNRIKTRMDFHFTSSNNNDLLL